MSRYKTLKKKQKGLLLFTSLFVALSFGFNNCGQTGDLVMIPASTDNGITSIHTEPPAENPPENNPPVIPPVMPPVTPPVIPPVTPPVLVPNYVSKSKMLSVGATRSNKVDLLVVIDNSKSMITEQANMAARFATLIDQLNGLDWQIGVITTDVSSDANLKDGRLIALDTAGSQFIISSQSDLIKAKEDFARVIQRPEIGSGNEQGIKATYRTLQRALDGNNLMVNKPNRDLIRSDAVFAVLVVTDANETPGGSAEARNNGDNLFNFIANSWMGKKAFVFNSIVVKSGDSVCKAKDGNESYGAAYESLSNKTQGIIGTVCATDYGSQLKLIGQKVVDQVKSIQLVCPPVDSNGDGKLDVGVFESLPINGGLSPSVLGRELQGYVVQGMNLLFANPLPEGSYQVKYICQDGTK
ncbi:MAG: vWA domain-containing protein [Bdellovibrionota bacterium]